MSLHDVWSKYLGKGNIQSWTSWASLSFGDYQRYKFSNLTAHNSQNRKEKNVFLSCYCHEIYRVEVLCVKKKKKKKNKKRKRKEKKRKKIIILDKNYDFCEYVKFGAISEKLDILLISSYLFESENASTSDALNSMVKEQKKVMSAN